MKKSIWILAFFVMSLYGLTLIPVYAQERRSDMSHLEDWEEIAGEVENLSLDTSMMVVKVYSGEETSAYQEITISITKEAKIVKNGQECALKDLKTGDKISVRYIATKNGRKEAYYIWVK